MGGATRRASGPQTVGRGPLVGRHGITGGATRVGPLVGRHGITGGARGEIQILLFQDLLRTSHIIKDTDL